MNDYPDMIENALKKAHPGWVPVLWEGLSALERQTPGYFKRLAQDDFLPTQGRLFAAFSQPFNAVRYVLVGEGPYPRAESASGYCFMDAAVRELWSETGLSKPVNRATSLRNFIKMLLVADGKISPDNTGSDVMKAIAHQALNAGSPFIQTLAEMQETMLGKGFLLLNASLVYRSYVPAARETKAWQPFLYTVLEALARRRDRSEKPVLILWGKMAEKLMALPFAESFDCIVSEHPYNLSFIQNRDMQALFRPLGLLYRQTGD
ncbi:uracil-DNA glycosylase [Oxalobacter paraformigenes]|nr:uracil-DNA glycosylase [Oxalobacter paraformigenes]